MENTIKQIEHIRLILADAAGTSRLKIRDAFGAAHFSKTPQKARLLALAYWHAGQLAANLDGGYAVGALSTIIKADTSSEFGYLLGCLDEALSTITPAQVALCDTAKNPEIETLKLYREAYRRAQAKTAALKKDDAAIKREAKNKAANPATAIVTQSTLASESTMQAIESIAILQLTD